MASKGDSAANPSGRLEEETVVSSYEEAHNE